MKTPYILFPILIIIVFIVFFAMNNNNVSPTNTSKIHVTTSFYPLYFFANEIAGGLATVTNITPAGIEPHEYEPTAKDMISIENSDLLILNGGNLETWGTRILKNINTEKTDVIIAEEHIDNLHKTEGKENIIDPHFWLSPPLAKQIAKAIADGLIKTDPENAPLYQKNSEALQTKLAILDTEYTRGLRICNSRNIVTSHSAFGYLAKAYNLLEIPISGLSPDAEPSTRQLVNISKFAKDSHTKYIFFESLVSPELSETIATEIGAQTLVLNPIEGLTNDEIRDGKNYITEMKNNLTNLKIALQCTQ